VRDNTPGVHALAGARIVVAPGRVLENATLVVRNGIIESVGTSVNVPADVRVWDMRGLTLYPGFIDAHAIQPATFPGIADRVGSLETGKDATLLITTGNPLDYLATVEQAYVQGREIDMLDIHKQLFEKYSEKVRQTRSSGN
jgi:imidazolonepropionase-like amidohydrolase